VTYLNYQLKEEKIKANFVKVEAIDKMKIPVDISGM
jgi:hypothetical protein